MKVAMVALFPSDPSRITGGVGGVSVYLTRALARTPGLSVEVISPTPAGSPARTIEADGVRIHYVPVGSRFGGFVTYAFTTPRIVRDCLADIRPDVVHVQAMAHWARKMPPPVVLTIHGIAERDILFRGRLPRLRAAVLRWFENGGRKRMEHTIVISPYVRQELAPVLGGRTWDIENPVEDSFFTLQRRPVPGRILYGGHFIARKNVLGLIEAFARAAAKSSELTLVLAGDGDRSPYGEECRRRVAERGLSPRVTFAGSLSIAAMRGELETASCLALCSFQETAPLVIGEAMAAGVPVVASNICGIPHMVEDGRTGRLVDPGDPEGIAAALLEVLQPGPAAALSARAKELAQRRFRASVVAARTYAVYQAALAGREKRA